ncbi:hypothetical protein ACJO2E_14305 [Marinobacter sp. M1N3S26]|uniref:hypothetical protein n=1 Tax=unclassified Marinobacter TaxID=83889 RepID=UPI00387B6A64
MAESNGPTVAAAISSTGFSVHVSLLTTRADGESWSVLASRIGSVVAGMAATFHCKSLILLKYLPAPSLYLTDIFNKLRQSWIYLSLEERVFSVD